jgi:hypothetical protein
MPNADPSFDGVVNSIGENALVGRYGATLKAVVRKLRDRCGAGGSGSFVDALNDYEATHECLSRHSRSDKTLKSNIAQMLGIVKKHVPELRPLVADEAIRFWNDAIVRLDRSIRDQDPESDMGEHASWRGLTWAKLAQAKRRLPRGGLARLAVDVYTTPGVPPRRAEWAHVVVYDEPDPPGRPPEENWFFLPPDGCRGAFVEFNSFKTRKTMESQRIRAPASLCESVREATRSRGAAPPCSMFGLDGHTPQAQSVKFNALLTDALNRALGRTDVKRPANLFRHMYLTDMFHRRLENLSDDDVKTTLRLMATSLDQAMYTYRIVGVGGKQGGMRGGASTGGASTEGMSTGERLRLLSELMGGFDPRA